MEALAYEIKRTLETSVLVQWLRFLASTAGGTGLIPGQGTEILHVLQQKKKKSNRLDFAKETTRRHSNRDHETLGWKKCKLESRLLGEISITSDMQITPPLWQKMERN